MAAFKLIKAGEKLDYSFDWQNEADDLGSPSDTISTSDWAVEPQEVGSPEGPTLSGAAFSGFVTTVDISEVTAGHVYRLTNTVTWASGIVARKTVVLRCE